MGHDLIMTAPELKSWYMPWLMFIFGTSLPCAAGFVFAWLITVNIGRDRSFSAENSRYLKYIAILAAVAAYFFIGNVIFLSLNMSHPGVMILSLMIVFAAAAVAVAAAALSHLVYKAALLQEESDLTI